LLLVIDPVARTSDGESVRIAKDVLRAGTESLKICFPESTAELERVLAHRGRRRPVVIGDDTALLRTVRILHREGGLAQAALSFVPVGPISALGLARRFGVPQSAVSAARAALDGVERVLDLLVDDSGGIVVGALRIPGAGPARAQDDTVAGQPPQDGHLTGHGDDDGGHPDRWHWLERGARSLVRTLTGPLPSLPEVAAHVHHAAHRLRVEADGVLLADLDRPVQEVSVHVPADGLAEVLVRRPHGHGAEPLQVRARNITVSGRDFRYRADEAVTGPVRTRTWTVERAAWRLTVPQNTDA
jgi:hypothetical protein